jgi:hypothetical protein
MTLQTSPLHTVSLRRASQTSNPQVHDAQIEQRSPRRRVVNGFFCCVLCIATAMLAGCGDSLGRDNSLSDSGVGGGGWYGTPVQPGTPIPEPSPPPQEPDAPSEDPSSPIIAPQPPSDPIQEPVEPIPEPSPPPEEPSVPPQEPSDPIQEPSPVVQCGSGLAALDLAGQCRTVSPTPGALEANDGTSTAGASVLSLAVAESASISLLVSWQPFGNNTAGYLVYYGATADTVNVLVSDLALNSGLYDASGPSVTYDSARDLGMYAGDTVCFRIHAYDPARTTVGQIYLDCRVI